METKSYGLAHVALLALAASLGAASAQEARLDAAAEDAAAQDTAAEDAVAEAAARRTRIDAHAQTTLDELFEQNAGAERLYGEAAGFAVFSATKAGFLVTGGGGTGVAVDKETGERTYMRMGTGGLGLGIGAQRYNLVILFEEQAYLNRFVEGGWDASASAQAAAGSDGITVTSSFIDGVAFYQMTAKGLMAQADVSGTRFWVVDELN